MIRYRHRFRVKAPRELVAEFHRRPGSLAAITPPPVAVRLYHAPARLEDGAEMAFALQLGPISIRWRARIEDVSDSGFTDRQLEGPFRTWVHHHSFEALEDGSTEVIDDVEASLRKHPLWNALGVLLWLGLPVLFAFRAWKTRALLQEATE